MQSGMALLPVPDFIGPVADKPANSLSFKMESIKFHIMYKSVMDRLKQIRDFFDEELGLPGPKQLLEDMEIERYRADTLSEKMFGLITVSGMANPREVIKILRKVCTPLEKIYINKKSENSSFSIMTYSQSDELCQKLRGALSNFGRLVQVRIKPVMNQDAKNL